MRHSCRHLAAYLRALFYHQARKRYRPGTEHYTELCSQPWRRHSCGEHSWLGHYRARHLAHAAGRQDRADLRGGDRLVMAYSILIVDDEALTLRTIGRALDGEGFEVSLANNGEEALKTISEQQPDLALVDVVLPGIDGIEVLRQAKKTSPATIV